MDVKKNIKFPSVYYQTVNINTYLTKVYSNLNNNFKKDLQLKNFDCTCLVSVALLFILYQMGKNQSQCVQDSYIPSSFYLQYLFNVRLHYLFVIKT